MKQKKVIFKKRQDSLWRNLFNPIVLTVAMLLSIFSLTTHAQTITSVSPASATQGDTGLSVIITLSPDGIEMPPPDAPVSSATIGSINATSTTRNDTIVSAVFDIPFDETAGTKDVTVTFVPPPDQGEPLVFSLADGFTVTELLNTPPSITTQPKSKSVLSGKAVSLSVSAYGSYPLTYQWQKDGADISEATSSTFTINSFAEGDVASYRCVVSNDYGSATSDEALLTLDEGSYEGKFPIVDTNQTTFFDTTTVIATPSVGEAFYGQDAQYSGNQPSYTDNGDGTVTDNVTGLMWAKSPDMDGDGDMDASDKKTYGEAFAGAETYNLAGYNDWRLPTIKEQYSLILFSGIDPSGYNGTSTDGLIPFIDTDYFDFAYGDTDAGERIIDSQYASSNMYVDGELLFGVNFADGRIKGYGLRMPFGPGEKTFFVMYVRGNTEYGTNNFTDNGDSTITDNATGLMWKQNDSKTGMIWEDALSYAENMEYGGYSDWRLPNVKELQSIVDYTRSPGTTNSAAIDPLFNCTEITNEAGQADYACYWSSTTHSNWSAVAGGFAAYVSFGRAMGYMNSWQDVHGAGAQRSDPKTGDPANFPTGHGPQGDAIRIYNYVRLVRDVTVEPNSNHEYNIIETGQKECYNSDGDVIDSPAVGEAFYGQDAQFEGTQFSFETGDGIVTDLNTGLMWQQVPSSRTFTWQEAVDYCESLELGGYDDWRMPSLKELFSISDFGSGWPYLDLDYFSLASGQVTKDEQYWSSNYYVGETVEGGANAAFGVNHVTGHIKAYPAEAHGPVGGKYVRAVRGAAYGVNDFVDNGDSTITDNASGLMWAQNDNGKGLDWENALAYSESAELAGYSDWRLPNVKELQSIVDYSYSPSATDAENVGPAIDPLFNCTPIVNEAGNDDYGYYWTNTSAHFTSGEPYYYAWYVAFGMAVNGEGQDFHGAGGVRFDTKVEGGPLGEGGERYYNYVRLVRNVDNTTGVNSDRSETSVIPNEFQLEQNYPNPFNPSTTISFSLPATSKVSLKIYNTVGQLMTTLVDEQLSQGNHEFQWQAANMSSGIYFYTLTSGSFSKTKRMILLK